MQIIPFTKLKISDIGLEFEGARFDNSAITFIMVEIKPGIAIKKHSHPYKEIIIILEGKGLYQLDDVDVEVESGNVLIIPAKAKHSFINNGNTILKQVDIHLNEIFITHWHE